MQYLDRAKPYKIESREPGSWYPLEQNRGVGKITAISERWISVVEDFLLFPGKKILQCLLGHWSNRSFAPALFRTLQWQK